MLSWPTRENIFIGVDFKPKAMPMKIVVHFNLTKAKYSVFLIIIIIIDTVFYFIDIHNNLRTRNL